MPRWDVLGNLAAGVGSVGAFVRINGRWTKLSDNAGGTCWVSPAVPAWQAGDIVYLNGTAVGQFANEIRGNGGVLAWTQATPLRTTVQDAESGNQQVFEDRALGDIGPDGSVITKGADGRYPGGDDIADFQNLGRGQWSGLTPGSYRPVSTPGVVTAKTLPGPCYGFRRHGSFCCYFHPTHDMVGDLVVQVIDDPTRGRRLVRNIPTAYRPDVRDAGNEVWVVYAVNEGEIPDVDHNDNGEIKEFRLSVEQLNEDLTVEAPQPPQPPEPPKPPDPPEVTPMRLPDDVQDILDGLYVRHKDLANGDDDQRRELTQMICETTRARKGPDWGWKRADPNRPPSKDNLAKRHEGHIIAWDLFNGATRAPNDHPESYTIDDQVFIEVAAIDHLVEEPHDPPDEPTDPALEARVTELERKIQELIGGMSGIMGVLEQMNNRLQQVQGELATCVRYGQKIHTLGSVSVPIFGSKQVKSDGIITKELQVKSDGIITKELPMPMYYAKSFLVSKTFWINLGMIVVAIAGAQEVSGIIPTAWLPYEAAIIAAINILLRFGTERPIALIPPNDVKPVHVKSAEQ